MTPNPLVRVAALAALLGSAWLAPAGAEAQTAPPSFALVGDVPYGLAEEPRLDRVIAEINASRSVRFVVHSGDVKQGSERCDDELLLRRFQQFQTFERAFIVTPGDNDWTDCHRTSNGGYLPTERLARFRQIFYPVAGRTTGREPFDVTSQAATPAHAAYVENLRWQFNGVTMATVHVVGSNNDLEPWSGIDATDTPATPRADRLAEFAAREAAALAWVDATFDEATAQGSAGVVLSMQANPAFEAAANAPDRLGFNAFIDKLRERALAFRKPVLLTHGDSHTFRLDKPLAAALSAGGSAMLENFSRLENFGAPSVHWVEVFVDPNDPEVFRIAPHIVRGNLFPR